MSSSPAGRSPRPRSRAGRVPLLAALAALAAWITVAPAVAIADGAASPASPASAAAPAVVTSGSLHIPDVVLTDQDGRPVRFWSDVVRGKVVAVSFVFTTCTTICLPLGANFARLETLLGKSAGAGAELVSVSIDPDTDTPARLKAWAGRFGGGGAGWRLLTGPREDVERLLRALEVYTPNLRDHSSLILVGNAATGTWRRISGLAPAADIAAQLARLGGTPTAAAVAAPKARGASR